MRNDTNTISTLVATFATHEDAREAVRQLHAENYHDTWIGLLRGAQDGLGNRGAAKSGVVVESDNAFARFFGAGDQSLHAALVEHGVAEAEAARIDGTLPIDSAILTVGGDNHPELAAQIVAGCGGELIGSHGSAALYDVYGDANDATGTGDAGRRLSSERLANLGGYRTGEQLDEPKRLQLREERLAIDKRLEKTGDVTIGKNVVVDRTNVDVPVYREELYVERRPAQGGAVPFDREIEAGETIRVPLSKETVVVGKTTVATEDVLVGQRRIDGVEHVSEDLKRETLDIDESNADRDRT
jgi:uncharacterized protein (TIGR02271 family)